jgi:glycosyltransferase involved in cell wall biosynthesis
MAKPLTIVSVTPVPLGRDSRTLKQAMTLARHGYRSIVVADCRRWDLEANRPVDLEGGKEEPDGRRASHWIWRYSPWVRRNRAIQRTYFLLWRLRYAYGYTWRPFLRLPPADLYCLHEFSAFPAVRLAASRHRAPILYDAHDFYSGIRAEGEQTDFMRRFIAPFQVRSERACIKGAAGVCTASDRMADLLHQAFGAKPVVVRNCHDARLDRPVAQSLRNRLGLRQGDFVLAVVGNHKKGQDIPALLHALAQLPAFVHVALIGSGYEVYQEAVRDLRLTGRVHFVGFVRPDELVPTVRGANAALLGYYAYSLNYTATLPNGLFQSLAAELPILYPELDAIASFMRAHRLGLRIDPRHPAVVASAVRRLLADADAAGTKEQRRAAGDRCAWEREERIFLEEVRRVLDRPQQAG